MVRLEARPGSGRSSGSGPHSNKLSKVTDRIAIYSTDLKNEARLKREGEERRAAMMREQVPDPSRHRMGPFCACMLTDKCHCGCQP